MPDSGAPGRLGHFEVVREIGRGGMGVVYLARDTRLGREVAIKALPDGLAGDRDRLARFEQEARTLASLNHSNIASIYGLEDVDARPYLVLEYVAGETLDRVLRRGPLPVPEAMAVARQLAAAVEYAHGRGVVHRDLKPSNVMVPAADASVKVLDFGLATALLRESGDERPLDLSQSPTTPGVGPATSPGMVLGTAGYLSPEQARGRRADRRSDIFSFGSVVYEMLAGVGPFGGDTFSEIVAATLKDEPDFTRLPRGLPEPVRVLLRLCLQKDPSHRLQHAGDCRVLLEDALNGGSEPGIAPAPAADAGPRLEGFRIGQEICRRLDRDRLDPRLIGHELQYLDNERRSDVLVLFVHAVGRDHEQWREHLRSLPYRAIAPTQVGFEPRSDVRFRLSLREHGIVLRGFLRALQARLRPRLTVLAGHSAGADLAMRLIAEDGGDSVPVDGILALEPNLALETCQVTRHFCEFEPGDEAKLLRMLSEFSGVPESLDDWIILYDYVLGTVSKCRHNVEGLRDFAREVVAPFREPGPSPFIGWYRALSGRVKCLRCVFSETPVYHRRILQIQLENLDSGCLGEKYVEESIRIERSTTHLDLYHAERVGRYLREIVQELTGTPAARASGTRRSDAPA
jgi:pimeloyl-ACP methyl ester carboxylesterase/predicted Ser/Thr protein kinase